MIKITTDYDMIKAMLWDDQELYNRISDDFTSIDRWNPKLSMWLGWFEDDVCKGLLSVTEQNAIVLEIHLHVPKKYRGKDSFKIGNGIIQHLADNCDKRFVKINARIPECYKDVVRFSEKCGFDQEGLDRKSYLKNGKYYNTVLIGRIIR